MKPTDYQFVLHLSDCFAPLYGERPARQFMFPGGEVHVDVSNVPEGAKAVLLTTRLTNSDATFYALMARDALKRRGVKHIGLFAPYIPYARQDRVATDGDPLSIAVYANLLKGFDDVFALDLHSDVSAALIKNAQPLNWMRFAVDACKQIEGGRDMSTLTGRVPVLISPDAGASKKISKLAYARHCDLIQANKYRDPETGKVTVFVEVPKRYKVAIVVDDICDGGATFTEIASRLDCEKHLVVTHGIFSKGLGPLFEAGYKSIHSTDSWGNSVAAFPNFYVHPTPTEIA